MRRLGVLVLICVLLAFAATITAQPIAGWTLEFSVPAQEEVRVIANNSIVTTTERETFSGSGILRTESFIAVQVPPVSISVCDSTAGWGLEIQSSHAARNEMSETMAFDLSIQPSELPRQLQLTNTSENTLYVWAGSSTEMLSPGASVGIVLADQFESRRIFLTGVRASSSLTLSGGPCEETATPIEPTATPVAPNGVQVFLPLMR